MAEAATGAEAPKQKTPSGPKKFENVPPFERLDQMEELCGKELREMRALLKKPEPSDVMAYRVLCAYKFNVERAAAQLDRIHEWREANNMDAVREAARNMKQEDFPSSRRFSTCHPHTTHHGRDRHGQPLSLERFGLSDPHLLTKLVTDEELMAYHLHHMENKAALLEDLSRERGVVMRSAKIIDLQGLGARALYAGGLRRLRATIKISQEMYPEMAGVIYIVNVPFVFEMMWKIVKPWLHPNTLAKIRIMGSNYAENLRKDIDPSVLPKWAGGDCECEGGCVKLYDPDHGMTPVEVAARASKVVEVDVPSAQLVEWEYRTRSKDIGFGVRFLPAGRPNNEAVVVLAAERCATSRGDYQAEGPGKILLEFDNSYSYFTSKQALYRVDEGVVPSEADLDAAGAEADAAAEDPHAE